MASEQHVTFCRICEPLCGMVATVEDGRLTIESTSRGTKLVVRAPLERRGILKRARAVR